MIQSPGQMDKHPGEAKGSPGTPEPGSEPRPTPCSEGSDGAPETLLGSVRAGPSLQLLLPAWQAQGRTAARWRPPMKREGSAPARGSSVRHVDAPKIRHPRWSLSLQSTHLEILHEKRCPCFGATFVKAALSLSVFSDDNLAKYLYALNCTCRSLMPMDHKSLLFFEFT